MVTAQVSAPPQEPLATVAPGFSPGVPAGQNLVLLSAAFGQDEANHGTDRYAVDNEGLVRVPLEAAGPLVTVGGFVLTQTGVGKISAGVLKLHHDDAAGCSYAGRRYLRDANGDVLVPAEATSELSAHGFFPVPKEATAVLSRRNRRGAIVP
jgi:hypothetical protein